MANFSDTLTPGQNQRVLDAHGIPWRQYKPNNDGWITLSIDDYVGLGFNSTCGINIFHGGFRDHYMSGTDEGGADLVKFTAMVRTGESDTTAVSDEDILDAIQWIKDLLGIEKGVKPPELDGEAEYANEWLKKENDNNYVRVPDDIWQSDLPASAKLVWMALFKRCGKGEIYSFPGIRRIATDTSMSINRVQRALSELKDAGVLFEKHRRADKPPNRYPVCKPVSEINTALAKNTKAPTKATDPVFKTNTACIQNGDSPVPKMNTELDTGNKNHESETKAMVENGKTPFCDSSFSPYGNSETPEPTYQSDLKKMVHGHRPPAGYQELFMATAQENIEAYAAWCELPGHVQESFNLNWKWNSEFKQWEDEGGAPAIWQMEPQEQSERTTV